MKILIAGKVNDHQAVRIKEEGRKRGHLVEGAYASELVINASLQSFEFSLRGRPIEHYDLIYFCGLYRRQWDWFLLGDYLAKKTRVVIVNKNETTNNKFWLTTTYCWEYLKQIEAGIDFPKTSMINHLNSVDYAIKDFGFPVIVKGVPSSQGKAVFLCHTVDEIKKVVRENNFEYASFIIREFIPNQGDIRVFIVGHKAVGAMLRQAKPGDFRNNISQGGNGRVFDLIRNPQVKKMAEDISQITKLAIAGVDIMLHLETNKPYLLEINGSPQFEGFEKYTKINVAQKIIEYFELLVKDIN